MIDAKKENERMGDKHTCFFCDKEFDELEVPDRDLPDFIMDDQGNDIPIVRYQFLCPNCDTWTE